MLVVIIMVLEGFFFIRGGGRSCDGNVSCYGDTCDDRCSCGGHGGGCSGGKEMLKD